jgi:acyl-CoA reductase-like NAD-dependent aldehyde dehydrogenase
MANVIDVRNPRTGQFDYQILNVSPDEVKTEVNGLLQAQTAWSERSPAERGVVIGHFADALQTQQSALAEALAIDTGRTTFAALEASISVYLARHWSTQCASAFEALESEGFSLQVPTVAYRHVYVPYPVVGIISPWNVPLLLPFLDGIAALAAGCSVLIKPSEITPRFIEPLQRAIDQVPEIAKVFRIVTGGPETGKAIIDHSSAICFTGSVATGRKVAQHAAANFIPAFLELGGKDPAIVMPDANIELAARAILRSALGMTGQACQSLERIYVHQDIFDSFVTEVLTQVDALSLTCDQPSGGDIAPLIFAKQVDTIQAQIDDAVTNGATLLRGGLPIVKGGTWYPPTVITNVNHCMKIMREETFGPVLPIMPFTTTDEALELANDSEFGLSGAVFSTNPDTCTYLATRMQAGGISINDASLTGVVNDVEKNSFKLSGIGGSRMGAAGMTRFLRKRALLTQTAEPSSVKIFSEPGA